MRTNLDPFDSVPDKTLWAALKAVQLDSVVKKLKGQLSFMVADHGGNLSVGQRQLLSLARAIARRSKIVVMDEATANIDLETDRRIQRAIQTDPNLKQSTILVIAHRIRTIAQSDMILVVDNGHLVEAGSPSVLAKREGSVFRSMVKASGMSFEDVGQPANSERLIDLETKL
uniref:ABC transporter domain-containing protein n=1 Tax=Amorphochlora amoebiformis TaxID=1561963 RepID=A0A7S0D8M6_9EUKA